jgi:uncharacterized surface protein with fasciclin (FAS1) repeats
MATTAAFASFILSACSEPTQTADVEAPATMEAEAEMDAPDAAPMQADIVDTAIQAGSFNTLVAAVQAAGLEATLRSEGPFTVFAPTDAAFAKLPAGTVETLLMPENKDQLVSILTYHVLPGAVMSSDIAGKTLDVATVEGSMVSIDATDGVMIDNATVITADIETSNGVIHVIDTVIMPGG